MYWGRALVAKYRRARPRAGATTNTDSADRESVAPTVLEALVTNYGAGGMGPTVLILGDSVTLRVSRNDVSATPLGSMLLDLLNGEVSTCLIAGPGFHVTVFLAILQLLRTLPLRPTAVVLPINVRTFGPQWALHPRWQYPDVIEALEAYAKSGKVEPKRPIPVVDESAYLNSVAPYHEVGMQRIGDFVSVLRSNPRRKKNRLERWRTVFCFHYLFSFETESRRFQDLSALIREACQQNIRVFAYLTPVNVEAGRQLHGSLFDEVFGQHCKEVVTAAQAADPSASCVRIKDWSSALPRTSFFHDFDATEHLNEHGRRWLARAVVEETRAVLAEGSSRP